MMIRCRNCAELALKLAKRRSHLLDQYSTSVVPSLGEQLQMDRERRRKKCGGVFNIGDKQSLQALMKLKEGGNVVLDVEKHEEDGHYYHRNCSGKQEIQSERLKRVCERGFGSKVWKMRI